MEIFLIGIFVIFICGIVIHQKRVELMCTFLGFMKGCYILDKIINFKFLMNVFLIMFINYREINIEKKIKVKKIK